MGAVPPRGGAFAALLGVEPRPVAGAVGEETLVPVPPRVAPAEAPVAEPMLPTDLEERVLGVVVVVVVVVVGEGGGV